MNILRPGLYGDDPLATVRLRQRSRSGCSKWNIMTVYKIEPPNTALSFERCSNLIRLSLYLSYLEWYPCHLPSCSVCSVNKNPGVWMDIWTDRKHEGFHLEYYNVGRAKKTRIMPLPGCQKSVTTSIRLYTVLTLKTETQMDRTGKTILRSATQ